MSNDNFPQLNIEKAPPGLLSRQIIAMEGNIATVEEIWDVKAPGCPMLVFDRSPFQKNESVSHVTRRVKIHEQALSSKR